MSPGCPDRWLRDVPLRTLTTWRIGGPARFLARPRDVGELRQDLAAAGMQDLPVFALGNGSNILFPDAGYPGLVIRMPEGPERFTRREDATLAHLAAGASLPAAARRLAALGWEGLGWAEGIPGTVGGALVNNAGAFGGEIAAVLESAALLCPDGAVEDWPANRFDFTYRHSALKESDPTEFFVLAASFRVRAAPREEIEAAMRTCRETRARRTPAGASCGSVFRNPPGHSAGRLIAEAGLGGTRRGDAEVSPRHANYILNLGSATAADALALIELCRETVWAREHIRLELEVQLVGCGEREKRRRPSAGGSPARPSSAE